MGVDLISVDVETSGLSPITDSLHGVGIGWDEDTAEYYEHPVTNIPVRRLLESPDVTKVFHNAPFDLAFLKKNGYEVRGPIHCTLAMSELVDENIPHGLKDLALKHLGPDSLVHYRAIMQWLSENKLTKEDLINAPPDKLRAYGQEDCRNTVSLNYDQWNKLSASSDKMLSAGFPNTVLNYYDQETLPLIPVLVDMNLRGCRVDQTYLEKLEERIKDEIEKTLTHLGELCADGIRTIEAGQLEVELSKRKSPRGKDNVRAKTELWRFNWSSPEQVGCLFCDVLDLAKYVEVGRTAKTGQWSCTDAVFKAAIESKRIPETLQQACRYYSDYKGKEKLLGTYIKGIRERIVDGRVYPQFLQSSFGKSNETGGTVSGRLSSRNPNFQNLPREGGIKKMFIPDGDKYCFVYADYSQLELRIAAHLSQDRKMMKALSSGGDIHKQTAQAIYGKQEITKEERQLGKTFNFALIYGASAYRLAGEIKQTLGIDIDVDEVEEKRRRFFSEYSEYAAYLENQKSLVIKTGIVVSHFGRVRRLPEAKEEHNLRFKERRYVGELLRSDGSKEEQFRYAQKKVRHAINQAYNFPVQSFGASMMKRAMIKLHGMGYDIVSQVHDSILIQVLKSEVEKHISVIVETLENIHKISVPTPVDYKSLTSLEETDVYAIGGSASENLQLAQQ